MTLNLLLENILNAFLMNNIIPKLINVNPRVRKGGYQNSQIQNMNKFYNYHLNRKKMNKPFFLLISPIILSL